jgi:predicted nuclease of predicted toxin-antitoxin system
MNLLLDMNLSPSWVPTLEAQGWVAKHWYSVGPVDAPDAHIMQWAKERGYCVVTNDLDFSAILAATRAEGPSVVQIRGQDLSPKSLGKLLFDVLRNHEPALLAGAILTVDARNARIRKLPLR